jgi:hypothetical protein
MQQSDDEKWVKVAEVKIHSGRLMLSDPAYAADMPEIALATTPNDFDIREKGGFVQAAIGPEDSHGVKYPVHVKYEGRKIAAVRVDFT